MIEETTMTTISETEIRITEQILAQTGEMLARLTPEQLKTKSWRLCAKMRSGADDSVLTSWPQRP
jgi:hypothetical protein